MILHNGKRKRGVLLTTKGLQKFQEAKRKLEADDNFGNRYTLEEMSARSGLYSSTISKVMNREGGVDKQTIERLFLAFNLKIDKNDYLSSNNRLDWGEALLNSVFYGRIEELTKLKQWILDEQCRLVSLLGIGGIGKTALSVELAQQIQDNFEFIIWRSLREAPPHTTIVANLIQILSDEQETEANLPQNFSERILRLLDYLQNNRCLVILDNAESILRVGTRTGIYREGYEGYGELFKRLGEANHQSCLVLTSREKPKEVAFLEGETLPVRSLVLGGLNVLEGQEIFRLKGISATEEEWQVMIEHYGGNPLALKIVATTIQDIFDGNVTEFLQQNTVVFGEIYDVLEQQFERLTWLEKDILYWLAINSEPIALSELRGDIVSQVPQAKLLESVESLLRRSLIEKATPTLKKSESLFTLQPVVMEYVITKFIEQICQEIHTQNIALFRTHALMKATGKDYVKDTQVRLIIKPVIDGLLNIFKNKNNIKHQLTQILAKLREESPLEPGYTAGNILNLLCHLETDLSGYDFSNLVVWQADLRNVNLHNVNFAHADLDKCVFAETFGGIFSVAFSPNGKLLATGDSNGEIRLYNVASGKQLLSCKGHTGWIWSVAFSYDGHFLASGSNDQTVKIWDTSTGQCFNTLQGHQAGIRSVAFSVNNQILVSGSEDQTVKLWDISTAHCFQTLEGHNGGIQSVALSVDSRLLATSSDDQTIKLWDINANSCLQTLKGHTRRVYSIAFSPDNQIIVSGGHDQTVKLWDVNTGKCLQTLNEHVDLINSIAFSSNGLIFASGSDDHTIKLWDVSSGRCLKTLQGHTSRVWSIDISSDGLLLASSSDDNSVKLWDISSGRCIKTLEGYINVIWSVRFSADGLVLASSSSDKNVRLWNASTGQCLNSLQGHSKRVTSVAFSPLCINEATSEEEKKFSAKVSYILASGSEDKTVKVWDVNTGQCLRTFQGHSNRVTSVAFSPDGKILASVSDDHTVKLWDINTNYCLHTLQGHIGRIWSVDFSTDGRTLASACHDQTIKLWDIETGRCLITLQGHKDWVWSVAFSPDGSTLASGGGDQTVKLWDITTGHCIRTLEGHTNCVCSVAFSPDGRMLASTGGDQTVKLWDTSTGCCIQTLQEHNKWIWSVAFHLDGQTVASGSEDETIKLWNVSTGECLKTLRSQRLYERMNIKQVLNLTDVQKYTLKTLGAVES